MTNLEITITNGNFIITVDGLEVGCGTLMPPESEDDFYYLERIDIDEQYRNLGYGTQALLKLKDIIGGYYLSADNADAQRLYDRIADQISDADYNRFGFAVDNGFGVYSI